MLVILMAKPKAVILTGFGINSEQETAWAFEKAGAIPSLVHFNDLAGRPSTLEEYQILVLSGGWSFADNIQSGRVLANKFKFNLQKEFSKFVDEDKAVLGICNGFQILAQLGAIPGWENNKRRVTLMHNRQGRFEDRWVRLRTESCVSPFAQKLNPIITLPIRHGEGQVVIDEKETLEKLIENRQIVFRYAGIDGLAAKEYPDNPNGSADSIAGLCNEQGNVVGLMPHPECHIRYLQNPHWTANPPYKLPNDIFSKTLKAFGFARKSIADFGNCMPFFESIVNFSKKKA